MKLSDVIKLMLWMLYKPYKTRLWFYWKFKFENVGYSNEVCEVLATFQVKYATKKEWQEVSKRDDYKAIFG